MIFDAIGLDVLKLYLDENILYTSILETRDLINHSSVKYQTCDL